MHVYSLSRTLIVLAILAGMLVGCVSPHGCSVGYQVTEADGCKQDNKEIK
jgi:hypothetical protein